MNTSIIASGKEQNINCRVVLWNEPDGLNFYKTGKLNIRNLTFDELKRTVDCFIVHHSVTYRAKETYFGLIARGLSVNFIIDDDVNPDGCATIYQCADIKDACYSQKTFNNRGSGVEIAYHPESWEHQDLYSKANQAKHAVPQHNIVNDTVHGANFRVFAPTDAQVKSLIKLIAGYCQLLDIIPEFPKDASGNEIKTVFPNQKGLLNHYNLDMQKIDAIGLDLLAIEEAVENKQLELAKEDGTTIMENIFIGTRE